MSVRDVIKNKVYESFAGGTGLEFTDVLGLLALACVLGIYIYLVYKYASKAAFYSKDLNITMAGMAVIVAGIIIAMRSNLIVSLGMVGALSIIRFRNAVKNPLDLLYLFWSTSIGIMCGVGLTMLAVAICGAMTILLLGLELLPATKASAVLVLRTSEENVDWVAVKELIQKYTTYYKEKSRNIRVGETEIIIEVKSKKEEELLAELKKKTEIQYISYLVHDGEFRL